MTILVVFIVSCSLFVSSNVFYIVMEDFRKRLLYEIDKMRYLFESADQQKRKWSHKGCYRNETLWKKLPS